MQKKKNIQVVLPAYNEEENLETMVQQWQEQTEIVEKNFGYKIDIAVVNDGSSDSTKAMCEKLESTYSNFKLLNHEHNKGLGEAVKTGILYAIKECTDCAFVCIMDCDNTQNPKYISDMIKKAENADVIIASRYQKGASVQGVAGYRLFTSKAARFVYKLILRVKNVRDYTCGYRLYSIDILTKCYEKFGDKIIEESGFSCMTELLYKLYNVGAVFAEIPFELRYDFKKGKSKMQVVKTAKNSVSMAFRLRKI